MTDFEATTATLRTLRRDYANDELLEANCAADPFEQFDAWLRAAQDRDDIDEAYAMNVATVEPDGTPSSRIVLLRGFDQHGFTFFTNYDSAKGRAIAAQSVVSLLFYWGPLEREVRIVGRAEKVSATESDEYWASRPHKSKLGAMLSRQSSAIASRDVLETEMAALFEAYPDGSDVPRPDHWGGYRIEPSSFEFWQGRRSRLHDRLQYTRDADRWTITRLAP